MKTMRDLFEVQERTLGEGRPNRGKPSKSFVLLMAVQAGLEKTFAKDDGWKFEIDGVRAGERRDAPKEDASDTYDLRGSGPDRKSILVSSSNDSKEHMALAQVFGKFRSKQEFEDVKAGDAKKIVAWVIEAAKKAEVI